MEYIIIVVLLTIAAETTYLTATSLKKTQRVNLSPVFVDTSVLIDGRVISIAESGFFTRPLYIPRSVVGELQFLADNADSEKRTRARHGLDVIKQLQAITAITVVIFQDSTRAEDGVDNRLLQLAKKHHGAICTIDYNLNKVAVVEGIEVLNVNDLAKTLRMSYLPGEKMMIELTQKGNDQHQGIGHLSDGTMVVVEHAFKQIGTIVEIEFIRGLQTAAGKMMFAKLVSAPAAQAKAPRLNGTKPNAKDQSTRKPQVAQAVQAIQKQPQKQTQKPQANKQQRETVKPASAQPAPVQMPAPQGAPQAELVGIPVPTHSFDAPVQTTPAQPVVTTRSAAPKDATNRSQKPRPSRRRQSPEDSMVELANQ